MITEAGFKPGEYTRKMIFQSMTQAARKKKSITPNGSRSCGLLATSPSVSIWLGIDMVDGHQQKPQVTQAYCLCRVRVS